MNVVRVFVVGAAGISLLLGACVTINVYFPAAAAEKAADTIIEEVWGEEPQSRLDGGDDARAWTGERVFAVLVGVLFRSAHAQADLDISTPEIIRLTASMKSRHRELAEYYENGAVGLSSDGLVSVRDAKAVPLAERNRLKQLVAEENADRNALYKEIAVANGHPEWERDIRNTFAGRWVQKAPTGAWYEGSDGWRRK